ncbi:MAG: hypothetical protein NZL89_06200 [Leptospiraceae bacterium]|nr:hypothetical protein [Leptospiraceae bacterium]
MPRVAIVFVLLLAKCTDLSRPPRPDAPDGGVILTVASDFATSFLGAIEIPSHRTVRDIVPLYSDSVLRYSGSDGATYVLGRLGADAIRRLENSQGYSSRYERSLGRQSNPQDCAFLPGNIMAVTFYNRNQIAFLERQSGSEIGAVDLSHLADADGYAEVASLTYAAGMLYAAVQRLNRAATDAIWPPVGDSYLVKIDPTTRQITKTTQLSHSNPISRLHYHPGRHSLLFAAPGRYYANATLDGACLEYDLATDSLLAAPITEAQAGHEIADCMLRADGTGIFLGNDLALNSVLAIFDPTTKSVTRVVATLPATNGGYFSDFLLHSNGKVYLADRNILRPGVRVFAGSNLVEETVTPLYTGLPPFVLEEVP